MPTGESRRHCLGPSILGRRVAPTPSRPPRPPSHSHSHSSHLPPLSPRLVCLGLDFTTPSCPPFPNILAPPPSGPARRRQPDAGAVPGAGQCGAQRQLRGVPGQVGGRGVMVGGGRVGVGGWEWEWVGGEGGSGREWVGGSGWVGVGGWVGVRFEKLGGSVLPACPQPPLFLRYASSPSCLWFHAGIYCYTNNRLPPPQGAGQQQQAPAAGQRRPGLRLLGRQLHVGPHQLQRVGGGAGGAHSSIQVGGREWVGGWEGRREG